ncbi:hypothetical protein DKX38_015212 [Salix brachista]|uniref:Uncharacterized protein n=1 Tax=Salix brachista TaxID=2182728 RepID=A0A5N5L4L5_9ROSI|nr:hypothetical protein DKX38_015212 [Salix brachista]
MEIEMLKYLGWEVANMSRTVHVNNSVRPIAYGNPNVPNAGFVSGAPGAPRSSWNNQGSSVCGAMGYRNAASWGAQNAGLTVVALVQYLLVNLLVEPLGMEIKVMGTVVTVEMMDRMGIQLGMVFGHSGGTPNSNVGGPGGAELQGR